MEIRSFEVDIDKGILKINGNKVEDPTIVTLPGPDGWPLRRAFNLEKRNPEEFNRIEVTAKNADSEKTSRSQQEERAEKAELIHLHTKESSEGPEVYLDDKMLHHIENMEIKSSVITGTAELLMKMKVKYP